MELLFLRNESTAPLQLCWLQWLFPAIALVTGAKVEREVVGRCGHQEREKTVWLHPCGPKADTALTPHPHPTAVAVTWQAWGLTSDRFHWIALTPSDSTPFSHRRHICKRKTPQILMQKCIAMVLLAPDFMHILPNHRKKVLPSLDFWL